MEQYRKSAVATLILFFFITLGVLFTEIPLIPESKRTVFILTKGFLIFLTLPFAYWIHRDIESQLANALIGICFFLYAIQGQSYRPLYYFSYFQVMTIYSFLFPVSKKIFRWVSGLGSVGFFAVFYLRWDQYVESSRNPVLSDMVLSMVAAATIAFIANTFFSSERAFREDAMKRFGHLGASTARIIHDLKGLISAPKIYVQMLQSRPALAGDAEAIEALSYLSRDLEGFTKVLYELNQLSSLRASELTTVSLEEIISSLRVILRKQLSSLEFSANARFCLTADKTLLNSMFMNLLLNSCDAFNQKRPKKPAIQIDVTENRVLIKDNAGGFDPKVIEAIEQGKFISTRPRGSGLGLLFVFDGMKKLGGRVKISNCDDGACVELVFPKKLTPIAL